MAPNLPFPISPQVRLNPRQSWILNSLSVELGFRILISLNMRHFCVCLSVCVCVCVCVSGGGGGGGVCMSLSEIQYSCFSF